jgi:hypothetical protein
MQGSYTLLCFAAWALLRMSCGKGESSAPTKPAERMGHEVAGARAESAWDLPFSSVLLRRQATPLWQRRVPYLPREYLDVIVRNVAIPESKSQIRVFFYYKDGSHWEATLLPGELAKSSDHASEQPLMRMAAPELQISESRVRWAIR